ncbi:MAG: RHS repeat-associated core domain-containing protein, partial [Pyrinomonadaceae bacterium]
RLYPPGSSSQVAFEWLVPDQLGTPRIIVDKTGSLATTKRHDYLPFGEELFAGVGGRAIALGYTGDSIRQKFTSYERDTETGLDFAQARYYSNSQGRFTSVDPLMASASAGNPQSWNRYAYVGNDPLNATDPGGMVGSRTPATGGLGQGGEFFGSMMHQINGLNGVYTGEQTWNRDWAGGTMDYGEYVSISMPQNLAPDLQNLDERTKIFVAVGLGEGTQFEVGSGNIDGYPSLSFDQLAKEQKGGSSIHFEGQAALKQLRDESYFMISALLNDVSSGRYKTLEAAAKGEAIGYAEGVKRLDQLSYPMYAVRARLMIEQLRYIDANGPNSVSNFWRGVAQPGGQRAFRQGDFRAGNTDFMQTSPRTRAYDRLPYWTTKGWKTPRR